ncbi:hypothetical protein AB6E53_02180 [Vibrio breoganii]|uniref:Lipoprotein n=1 Tax=Vibrio breoganii TaxID=553239 RepID=A0AAP8SWR3_9VIBR|nr:hypothetical protein [Vibrio breoganii]PMP10195.1 hypothetical protein BCS93_11000 [Vibrio breoganii]
MRKLWVMTAIAVSMTGCVNLGSEEGIQYAQREGMVRINDVPPNLIEQAGYDFTAYIGNIKDIGFNSQDKEDRLTVIRTLRPECGDFEVLKEAKSEEFTVIGVDVSTYLMTVKCEAKK